jgi:hypothetical protein
MNTDDSVLKLQILLQKKGETLGFLQDKARAVAEEISSIQGQIAGISESINELLPKGSESRPSASIYSDVTLTLAILDVINRKGEHPGLSVKEIMEHLKAGGFKSEAKEFYSSVYVTASRLVEQGKIRPTRKDGTLSLEKIQ